MSPQEVACHDSMVILLVIRLKLQWTEKKRVQPKKIDRNSTWVCTKQRCKCVNKLNCHAILEESVCWSFYLRSAVQLFIQWALINNMFFICLHFDLWFECYSLLFLCTNIFQFYRELDSQLDFKLLDNSIFMYWFLHILRLLLINDDFFNVYI